MTGFVFCFCQVFIVLKGKGKRLPKCQNALKKNRVQVEEKLHFAFIFHFPPVYFLVLECAKRKIRIFVLLRHCDYGMERMARISSVG